MTLPDCAVAFSKHTLVGQRLLSLSEDLPFSLSELPHQHMSETIIVSFMVALYRLGGRQYWSHRKA